MSTAWAALAAVLAVGGAATVWDLRTMQIPNLVSAAGLGAGLLLHLAYGGLHGALMSLFGMAVAGGPLLAAWLGGAVGGGDVKLAAALGSIVAWPAAPGALLAGGMAMAVWSALVALRHRLRSRAAGTAPADLRRLAAPQALPLAVGALVAVAASWPR